MENQITTKVNTHVIITYSKGFYYITAEQNTKLEQIGLDDLFEVNDEGEKIKGSSIAEVMTIEKFYLTHPQHRNQNYGQPPTNIDYPDTRNGKGMVERLDEYYEKHPEKKNTTGYKFFMEHRKIGSGDNKKAKFKFEPDKETWDEFKMRAGWNNAK